MKILLALAVLVAVCSARRITVINNAKLKSSTTFYTSCQAAIDDDGDSGVYSLRVGGTPIWVYCEKDTTSVPGTTIGWTVMQRRGSCRDTCATAQFNTSWSDYAGGFGDPTTDYWIGNDNLNVLTTQQSGGVYLRIEITSFGDGSTSFADYLGFSVGTEATGYVLTSGYLHNTTMPSNVYEAGILSSYHNGMTFVTNDKDSGSCSVTSGGGWWYNPSGTPACFGSNLNGLYYKWGETVDKSSAICWDQDCKTGSLQSVVMKFRSYSVSVALRDAQRAGQQ